MKDKEKRSRLTMNRAKYQSFYIGDDVRVTLLQAKNRHARLLIEAPRSIPIRREEVRHQASKALAPPPPPAVATVGGEQAREKPKKPKVSVKKKRALHFPSGPLGD